jgi:hypothetical protein
MGRSHNRKRMYIPIPTGIKKHGMFDSMQDMEIS